MPKRIVNDLIPQHMLMQSAHVHKICLKSLQILRTKSPSRTTCYGTPHHAQHLNRYYRQESVAKDYDASIDKRQQRGSDAQQRRPRMLRDAVVRIVLHQFSTEHPDGSQPLLCQRVPRS